MIKKKEVFPFQSLAERSWFSLSQTHRSSPSPVIYWHKDWLSRNMRMSQVLSIPLSLHALHNRQKRSCLALGAFTQSSNFSHQCSQESAQQCCWMNAWLVMCLGAFTCLTGIDIYILFFIFFSSFDWSFITNSIQLVTLQSAVGSGLRWFLLLFITQQMWKIRQINDWTWKT